MRSLNAIADGIVPQPVTGQQPCYYSNPQSNLYDLGIITASASPSFGEGLIDTARGLSSSLAIIRGDFIHKDFEVANKWSFNALNSPRLGSLANASALWSNMRGAVPNPCGPGNYSQFISPISDVLGSTFGGLTPAFEAAHTLNAAITIGSDLVNPDANAENETWLFIPAAEVSQTYSVAGSYIHQEPRSVDFSNITTGRRFIAIPLSQAALGDSVFGSDSSSVNVQWYDNVPALETAVATATTSVQVSRAPIPEDALQLT
jgi:hypothetical protein